MMRTLDYRELEDRSSDEDLELAGTAFENSEREIFGHAADMDDDDIEYLPYPGDPAADCSVEDVQGWDGRPLSIQEIAASNHFDGIDRPIEIEMNRLLTEQEVEIRRLRGELEERHLRPEREERQQQHRDAALAEMLENPDAVLNVIGQRNDQVQQLTHQKIELSMGAAHQRHGERFEAAYHRLQNELDPTDPVDRAIVQRIVAQPDPGEALIAWNEGGRSARAGRSAGGMWRPGSRQGSRTPARNARVEREDDQYDAQEPDVFADATQGHVSFWDHEGGGLEY